MQYSHSQSPSPRTMDRLEGLYNQEAEHHWQHHKKHQQLYYRIAQMESASISERKSMEKELKDRDDQRVKAHWRAEEERYREMKRRRREEVDNTRKANQNMSFEQVEKAKKKDDYTPYNDFNDFYAQQLQRQKHQKQQFMRNAEEYQRLKKEKQRNEKLLSMQVQNMKQNQRAEQERKRQAELKRIRDKHQQNVHAYVELDQIMRKKQRDEDMLESLIVNKGAEDQQLRILERRAQLQAKDKARREQFIVDLKSQLENDTTRQLVDKKTQLETQRIQIEQRNRYFSEMDRLSKMRKSQNDKEVLETLKSQVKPRKLLPEPDAPQKIGLGSPVNIGKVVGDDRRRQLQWIEKSLLREVHY